MRKKKDTKLGHKPNTMRQIVLLIGFLMSTLAHAQTKQLLKYLEEREFAIFLEKTNSYLSKKPQHAGIFFLKALYFSDQEYAHANQDSAYFNVRQAIRFYQSSSEVKQELEKNYLGINDFVRLKNAIEIDAFKKTENLHTEIAYQEFIEKYPSATLKDKAIEERNRLAFESAKKMNTSGAYREFLEKYPNTIYTQEAKAASEILFFQEKTDGSLVSLDYFLQLYPQTPYRNEVERRIYFGFVNDHTPKVYKDYIDYSLNNWQNTYTMQAWWWLWFFSEDKNKFFKNLPPQAKAYFQPYSQLHQTRLFPSLENEKIVLIDQQGTIRANTQADNILADGCQSLQADFFLAQKDGKIGAFDYTGRQIANYEYDHIEELSDALLKVRKNGKIGIVQKGGYLITDCIYDDIEVLGDYLRVRMRKKYGLLLPNSQVLVEAEYDNIEIFGGDTVAITQNELISLLPRQKLLEQITKRQLIGDFKWKNYEISKGRFLKVKKDGLLGIFDFSGLQLIDFMATEIEETKKNWAILRNGKWYFYDLNGKLISQKAYQDIWIGQNKIAVRSQNLWGIVDLDLNPITDEQFTEISYFGGDIFVLYSPQKVVILKDNTTIELPVYQQVSIFFPFLEGFKLPTQKDKMYIVVSKSEKQKGILDESGKVIIEPIFSEIYLSDGYFIVQKDQKKGLYDLNGKQILPISYKSIVPDGKGSFLLQEKNFGFFKENKIDIPTIYESLPRNYDPHEKLFIVRSKNNFAIADSTGKPLFKFAFNEIRFFSEKIALVRQAQTWFLFDINEQIFLDFTCDTFEYIKESKDEVIIKYFVENQFGLISSKNGILVKEMQGIRNIGSYEKPFFLAEKQEGEKYHIFYINQKGKIVSEGFFSEESYQKLSCE